MNVKMKKEILNVNWKLMITHNEHKPN